MKEDFLVARAKCRYLGTTDSKHWHEGAPNLLQRGSSVEVSDRVWVSDITDVPTRQG